MVILSRLAISPIERQEEPIDMGRAQNADTKALEFAQACTGTIPAFGNNLVGDAAPLTEHAEMCS
jgi:hypothetical protein